MSRIALAASAAALSAVPVAAQDGAALDRVFARWATPGSPGCAVAIAEGGRTVFSRGYGSADLEHDQPIRPDTVFEAGSVSKQFTAAAVLALVADGKLKLDDDVRTYLPELPTYERPITIDQLLTHTSGLRDWGAVMALAGWPRGTRAYTQDDVLDIVARQRALNYPPGAEYSYTNSGYNLLAIIVARVSGQSLATFTAARFFRPLGMASTSWRDDFRAIVPGRAIAYRPRANGGYEQAMPFEDAHGNGGLLTTTADLLRWNDAISTGRLGRFVTAELQRPGVLRDGTPISYARGLFVSNWRGRPEIWHSGTTAGYKAWLGRWPGERLSLAMLCNSGGIDSTGLAHQAIDAFLGTAPAADAAPVPAAGRAGLYVDVKTGMPFRLGQKGDTLATADGAVLAALPAGRARSHQGEITFTSSGLELVDGEGKRSVYRRAEPWVPAPAELAGLTGRYASEEAGAAYRATLEEGRLVLRLEHRPQVTLSLEPSYRDVFAGRDMIARIVRNGMGRPVALGLGTGRVRDIRFARTLTD